VDFFQDYLAYTEDTESPRIYHRWCAIAATGAMLGRNIYIRHGHSRYFPNIYCMLIGEAAARKSTTIKIVRRLMTTAGYQTFAADKTSKEQFLVDLAKSGESIDTIDDIQFDHDSNKRADFYKSQTFNNLWGNNLNGEHAAKEMFIAADEFNEFAGVANHEFYTTLGNLWDWDDSKPFTQTFKTSRSVEIIQPTISILGGNTQENFARAFPPEIIGQGFFSRLLLIHGERTGKKIAFPKPPTEIATKEIVRQLQEIRKFGSHSKEAVELELTSEARSLLEIIYIDWSEINDTRFVSYNNRRFTHLLKLCLIVAGAKAAPKIDSNIVIEANTYLTAAELLMPTALGEFGKGKNSDIANKIIAALERSHKPLKIQDIWILVRKDLNKMSELSEILHSLEFAGQMQFIKNLGWLPKKAVKKEAINVDWSLLTSEERGE